MRAHAGIATARTRVQAAMRRINEEIRATTDPSNMYSRGLSTEGYAGGYRDALSDMLLVLNGVQPTTRGFWRDWK